MIVHSFKSFAPPVAEWFCAQNWYTGGAGFNSQSHVSSESFGVFCGFLRNSLNYGLEFLRNIPHGGHPTYSPRSHNGRNLTTTATTLKSFQQKFATVNGKLLKEPNREGGSPPHTHISF